MAKNELREKIEYYIITLSFTVLAVAIQTASKILPGLSKDETLNIFFGYIEIFSWILFFLSGLFGILKLYIMSHESFGTNIENMPEIIPFSKHKRSYYLKISSNLTKFQFIVFIGGFILLIVNRAIIILR